jgi:uncharacterized protein (TIGR02266 family)
MRLTVYPDNHVSACFNIQDPTNVFFFNHESYKVIKIILKNHMENSMDIDRRKHVRTPAQLIVQYSDQRLFFTEFLYNLSLGGICIEASKPLEPGTRLIVSISTQPAVKAEAIVAWSKKSKKNRFKHEIGIRFVELPQHQKSQIADIITSIYWEMNPTH